MRKDRRMKRRSYDREAVDLYVKLQEALKLLERPACEALVGDDDKCGLHEFFDTHYANAIKIVAAERFHWEKFEEKAVLTENMLKVSIFSVEQLQIKTRKGLKSSKKFTTRIFGNISRRL